MIVYYQMEQMECVRCKHTLPELEFTREGEVHNTCNICIDKTQSEFLLECSKNDFEIKKMQYDSLRRSLDTFKVNTNR